MSNLWKTFNDWVDSLDLSKWINDFKDEMEFRQYVVCVARHIMGIICAECPMNFYEKILHNKQNKDDEKGLAE